MSASMPPLGTALGYAARGRPVFPCSSRKIPMVRELSDVATTDPATITSWWTDTPYALIGMPTGERTGIAVLDIDRKNGRDGFRTLAKLGYGVLPRTPTVLTPTGGSHLHFDRPDGGFRCTVGATGRGIGDGLDWRCDGGYVILPSPGSGYAWGEWNYANCTRLLVPADLLPSEIEPTPFAQAGIAGRLRRCMTANNLAGVVRTFPCSNKLCTRLRRIAMRCSVSRLNCRPRIM